MRNTNHYRSRSQRGAVLIVALVLLLVLTVLGTAGIRDTTMEERMAGNFRDHAAALEAAETALRTGEGGVGSTAVFTGLLFDGTDGTYEVTEASQSVDPQSAANYGLRVDASVVTYGGELLVDQAPEYYIEQLPEIELPASDLTVGFQDQAPRVRYYRVTGKGYGVSPNTEVILQSTYFR
jgi:type IV pilus assembly protein PilX